MEEHHIQIPKSARYITIGQPTLSVKNVWICLHGYGQLAKYFARNFSAFQHEERLFIIPEGPHRFYLNGTAGRVGASWMTKEDRLNDIKDQFQYLETLLETIQKSLSAHCHIHVLGFSQGVSTAFRWVDQSQQPFKSLVAWAGSFPPDIDYKLHRPRFATLRMHCCFGDNDEFISKKDTQGLLNQLKGQEIEITPHYYQGGHKMYAELLGELIEECEI